MKWEPEVARESIVEWAKKEIVDTTEKLEGLVRFLFGVTASSIVALVAISRLISGFEISLSFLLAISAYLIGIVLLLGVLLRKTCEFNSKTDLHTEYMEDMKYIKSRCWLWFVVWCCAVGLSGWSIYA